MAGEVREIPGYYYDRDKRKYFRIQASSAAPASAAYSSHDVKRRKLQEAKDDASSRSIARLKGRTRRSATLKDPFLSDLLAAEPHYSSSKASQSVIKKFVQHGIVRQSIGKASPLFDVNPRFDISPSTVDMRITTDALLTMRLKLNDDYGPHKRQAPPLIPNTGLSYWIHNSEDTYYAGRSNVTSLTANRTQKMMTRTWLSDRQNEGISIFPMFVESDEEYTGISTIMGPGRVFGADVSVYSSTPAPAASSLLFAYGTSLGIIKLDKTTLEGTYIQPHLANGDAYTAMDVFALGFLSDNHNILLSGGRRGILDISDLRIPTFGPRAETMTCSSAITNIKSLDSNRVLVSGLNSMLCQYDLRYRKLERQNRTTPKKHKKWGKTGGVSNTDTTRHILWYDGYNNTASIQHGLDVDLELGIVAVAQEHHNVHAPVEIFSLHGGHKIPMPALIDAFDGIGDDEIVKCVQWAPDIEHRAKSLYAACGGIYRFAWTGSDDGEA